jgi:transposase-like protein
LIRLNDEQYWLYAAVDLETNELLHIMLETTRANVIAYTFFRDLREKHDVDNAMFLVDGAKPLNDACRRHGLGFRYECHGNRNSVEPIYYEVKRKIPISRTVLETPKQKLQTSGSDRSPSYGIN